MTWRILAIAALSAALVGSARGESTFSFAGTPGKLPKDVVPRSYVISLRPDAAAATLAGDVTIELDVLKETRAIVFNALELAIPTATLDGRVVGAPRIDEAEQTGTIALAQPLAVGRHTLKLEFTGKIGTASGGLYSIKYATADGERTLLATQMEPTDARRMFPCWDEPVFRATFKITTRVPRGQIAVSNMPRAEEIGGMDESIVSFQPTPPMASYLVVLCIGEFEQITDEVDGIKLGVWTTKGKSAQGRLALQQAKEVVHYYNDYFGVKYPLPKLDMIAVPGGFGGAMENWGGIVYAENTLLFDPATSAEDTKRRIYGYIAHEVAHQWFGNLVTMAWWDNLWLNEGFASWMGTKTTDRANAEWKEWLRSSGDREDVMSRDARRATHPIQQPVLNDSGASDAFDEITYDKGLAFIRMLENFLGEETFRAGIRGYMAQHAYGSATTADLWAALESASAKPTADSPGWLARLADEWTTRSGYPVVSVSTRDRDGQVEVTMAQEHFTVNDPAPEARTWKIPVSIVGIGRAPINFLLEKPTDTVLVNVPRGTVIKLNSGNTGLYRASYSAPMATALAGRFASLAEEDRLNLLGDAWAMVEAGRGDLSNYLNLVSGLGRAEVSQAVWSQAINNLWTLYGITRGTPAEAVFDKWEIALLREPMARLGWNARPAEPPTDAVLRAELITVLGTLGEPAMVAEARRRFAEFLAKPESLANDLRSPVAAVVGRQADIATWQKLYSLARATESQEERRRYYRAFESVADESLAKRTLEMALTNDHVFTQWWGIVSGVSRWHPDLAWDFATKNADALLAKIPSGGAFTTRNTYFGGIAGSSDNPARAAELEAFVARKVGPDGAAEAAKSAEAIRAQAAFKMAQLPRLKAWLDAR